jgi:signal transduction histidine kinase
MEQPGFVQSIRGKIALANLANFAVLVVLGLVAISQFRELGNMVGVVSDRAEVMLRLHYALDEREDLIDSFRKGYAGEHPNRSARAQFSVLVTDLEAHLQKAQLVGGDGPELLTRAARDLVTAKTRAGTLDQLSADERKVAVIELEKSLRNAMEGVDTAELAAIKASEQRLATIKLELARPERLFWIAAAACGLMALAISAYLRRRVSKPLKELNTAVALLAKGEPKPIRVSGRDELGRLGLAFNDMARTITERNRSLKLVLDNVRDGLVSCDRLGTLVGEPSKNALDWLGQPAAGQKVWEYLAAQDTQLAWTLELGIGQVFEDILPVEVSIAQLPRDLERGGRSYALNFRQVLIDGNFERLLVVLTDVTEHRAILRKEQESRDLFNLACCALRDWEGYVDFISDMSKRLGRASMGQDVMLELHTAKGTAGVMGCENFASRVHDVESRACSGVPVQDSLRELEAYFRALVASCEATLGRTQRAVVVVPRADYDRLCSLLAQEHSREASILANSWIMQRVENVLERLSANTIRYASQAGKRVRVEIDSGGISVPRGHLDELWHCLVHLLKNTVAHGIEEGDRRIAAGKPAEGRIRLVVAAHEERLHVSVCDDGAGIDWRALGVASDADDRVRIQALVAAGSSAEVVTQLSGRGVGLAAVFNTVESLHGELAVNSRLGQGTEFEVTVPVSGWLSAPHSLPPAALQQAN